MVRRPNVLGILIISSIYWGSLLYWQWDTLFGDDKADQMRSLYAIALTIPYVGFILWGTSTDLPDNFKEIKYIGRGFKPCLLYTSDAADE